ncbi:hypothetical protein G7092_02175 [Mucilaginibacter sp. HC2]|uniref:hypothetical protein n=1 Tax=Mucilaginibacter inviolabilis TaxID=2714892 RepID=UPI00140E5EAE|nr:hypothetical protein [Mucilaginibacter inviolabilis]NHA02582.1 hypothetical protein [Mucilaginibacter inviolabilis]
MEMPAHQVPRKRAILPYYLAAVISLLLISALTLLSVGDFRGHFFQPHILAITHLTVFGWATMVIMGASNQLIPVIADKKLYSENLPLLSFLLITLGTCLLVHAFWVFELGAMIFTGAGLILTALIIHVANIILTTRKATPAIAVDFMVTAHLWLIVTASIGLFLLLNFRFGLLPENHLHYLRIHASIGMAGWFLLLVIGVSSRLVPMFLLSRKEVRKYLTAAYYLINIGLVLLLAEGMIFQTANGLLIDVTLVIGGLAFYLVYLYHCYRSAIRKKMDAGMKMTTIAIAAIALPFMLLMAALFWVKETPVNIVSAYGYAFFAGFITILIMGQTFKTLPFIIWTHLNKPDKIADLQPRDLYSEKLVKIQLYPYLTGFLLFLTGILLRSQWLMYPGSALMTTAALLYAGHVFYIINKLRK